MTCGRRRAVADLRDSAGAKTRPADGLSLVALRDAPDLISKCPDDRRLQPHTRGLNVGSHGDAIDVLRTSKALDMIRQRSHDGRLRSKVCEPTLCRNVAIVVRFKAGERWEGMGEHRGD